MTFLELLRQILERHGARIVGRHHRGLVCQIFQFELGSVRLVCFFQMRNVVLETWPWSLLNSNRTRRT
ncbi:unnamed protein product [Mycena citricolor]|uniref:Uncharacterized protein n=1 Tax=Mycena citricolor TaxID=2018698 RepID=A0AAD2GVF3_9AGAR|nr:unnamed protein product [Mycena citricolor]CAK5277643.1 unnamed protein product [Mycena citricolor]